MVRSDRVSLVPWVRPSVGLTWVPALENGVVEIESEWAARDREWKIFGAPARTFLCPG
jgi:hypothetical protein